MNTKFPLNVVRKSKYSAGAFVIRSSVLLNIWVAAKFIYAFWDLTDLRDSMHPTVRDYVVQKFMLRAVIFATSLAGYFAVCYTRGLYTFILAFILTAVTIPGTILEDVMGIRLSWDQQELLLSQCNKSYGSPQGLSYYPTWRGNDTIDTPELAADWCYRQWRDDWEWNLNWFCGSMIALTMLVSAPVLYLRQVWFSVREAQIPKPKQWPFIAEINRISKEAISETERVTIFAIVLYIMTAGAACKATSDYQSLAEVVNHPILSKHVEWMAFINVFVVIVGLFNSLGLLLGPMFWGVHSLMFLLFLIPGSAFTSIAEISLTWNNKTLLLDVCADSKDMPGGLTYAMGFFGANVAGEDSRAGRLWCNEQWRYTWMVSMVAGVVWGLFLLIAFVIYVFYFLHFVSKVLEVPENDGRAIQRGGTEESIGLIDRGRDAELDYDVDARDSLTDESDKDVERTKR